MAKEYYYDFHLHSCLSPCGETEMTPYNIVAFAKVLSLDMIALTDHNTVGNCRTIMEIGKQEGLTVIPGMELSTAEDIHMICLFPTIEEAESFGEVVHQALPPIQNKAEVYGQQLLMDETDGVLGEEEYLLLNATSITFEEAPNIVRKYSGICYPAHIDRPSNSLLSILGMVDESMDFTHFELSHHDNIEELYRKNPVLKEKTLLRSSDAHWLARMAAVQYDSILLEENSIEAVFDWFQKK